MKPACTCGLEIADLVGHDFLGHRTARALARGGTRTIDGLRALTDGDLRDHRNIGAGCVARVRIHIPEAR